MRKLILLVTAGVMLVTAVAVMSTSATAGNNKATAAVKFACPDFRVVVDDPAAGFKKGVYRRRNFSEPKGDLTCDDSYHVLRSYLYHPDSHKGWTVGRLKGDLANKQGKRFLKNGTDSQVGFDVFK